MLSVSAKVKHVYTFIAIVGAWLLAGYLTSVICRFLLRRARRPSWMIGPATACLGAIPSVAALFQRGLFEPSDWSGALDAPLFVPLAGVASVVVALLASLSMLSIYRNKYEIAHPLR